RFAAALRLAATLRIPAALRLAALRFPTVLWATQSYSVSHGAHGPAADRALFDSQLLPPQAFGTGSEGFWQPSPSDRNAAVWTHIGSILLGWLLPLILFLVKKDESPYVREHAR